MEPKTERQLTKEEKEIIANADRPIHIAPNHKIANLLINHGGFRNERYSESQGGFILIERRR